MRPGFGGGGARVLALWRHVWVLLATFLVACGPAPVGPLKVGLNPWVGYDPLVLARDKGLVDARKVKVVELSSSSDSLRQFRNGQLDAAALTLDEALRLADAGEDIRIIAVLSMSAGADVVMARQDIRSPADLRGRHIAVERTTVGALMLQRLLQAGGLAMGDVFVHNMEASQHLSALRSGLVEAAVTFEPLAGTMRAEGFRSVFDSRQMPGEIADVIVVHARTLASRPDQVLELARGWRRGLEVFQKEPQLSAELLSAGVDLSPADYLSTLKGLQFVDGRENRALLGGQPRLLGQRVEGLALTLQMMGLLRDRPDWGLLLEEDWPQRLADGTEDLS